MAKKIKVKVNISSTDKFARKLKSLKIGHIFLDLDNTLVDSRELFVSRMRQASEKIASDTHDVEEDFEFMSEVLSALRDVYSVNPVIMSESLRITALRYGHDFYEQSFQKDVLDPLMEIYDSGAPVFDGVWETMRDLSSAAKMTDVKIHIFSHGTLEWTKLKVAKAGLLDFCETILNVEPWDWKDEKAWKKAFEKVDADPRHTLVVGDNWNSDIRPALENGVPQNRVVRISTGYDHANKDAIEGVVEIDSFSAVLDVIMNLN